MQGCMHQCQYLNKTLSLCKCALHCAAVNKANVCRYCKLCSIIKLSSLVINLEFLENIVHIVMHDQINFALEPSLQ